MALLGRHRALIVVDVQNDFCEGGSLPVAGGAGVAARISEYVRARPGDYDVVVATRDWHVDPGPHFSATPDYRDTWPVHCVARTAGGEFHPDLDRTPIEAVFSKGASSAAYSGFEGTDEHGEPLAAHLRGRGVTEADIVGLATDHCVRATALDARREGFETRVLTDLCAGVAPETTADALAEMRAAGVTVTTSSAPVTVP